MQSRTDHFLLAAALLVSTLSGGALVTQAIGAQSKTALDEIDVKRINVREEDGTLRLVISNTQRLPGVIVKGKEHPHPNRRAAGIGFYNDEGTESGGLMVGGSKRDGKVTSAGYLAFDRYEQDQVLHMIQEEGPDSRYAAFIVSDRPDQPMDLASADKVTAMPPGPARDEAMKRLLASGSFGVQTRLQLGRGRDRSSALVLHDAAGKPRLHLEVTAEGAAAIKFLDESGEVIRTVTP